MSKPTIRQLSEQLGMSRTYACDILNGKQDASRPLAITIFRRFGWKPEPISQMSENEIAVLEAAEVIAGTLPWKAAA